MSVEGRTDSSNDNVFESVESEQGILLLNTEKKQYSFLHCPVCLFILMWNKSAVTWSDFLDKQSYFENDNEFMQLVSVKFFCLFSRWTYLSRMFYFCRLEGFNFILFRRRSEILANRNFLLFNLTMNPAKTFSTKYGYQ